MSNNKMKKNHKRTNRNNKRSNKQSKKRNNRRSNRLSNKRSYRRNNKRINRNKRSKRKNLIRGGARDTKKSRSLSGFFSRGSDGLEAERKAATEKLTKELFKMVGNSNDSKSQDQSQDQDTTKTNQESQPEDSSVEELLNVDDVCRRIYSGTGEDKEIIEIENEIIKTDKLFMGKIKKALANGKSGSKTVHGILVQPNGLNTPEAKVSLFGLNYYLKTQNRIKEKIERIISESNQSNLDETLNFIKNLILEGKIKDILRITFIINESCSQLQGENDCTGSPGNSYINILQDLNNYLIKDLLNVHEQHTGEYFDYQMFNIDTDLQIFEYNGSNPNISNSNLNFKPYLREKMKEIFQNIDKDNNGIIEKTEFRSFFNTLEKEYYTGNNDYKKVFDQIIRCVSNKTISYEIFENLFFPNSEIITKLIKVKRMGKKWSESVRKKNTTPLKSETQTETKPESGLICDYGEHFKELNSFINKIRKIYFIDFLKEKYIEIITILSKSAIKNLLCILKSAGADTSTECLQDDDKDFNFDEEIKSEDLEDGSKEIIRKLKLQIKELKEKNEKLQKSKKTKIKRVDRWFTREAYKGINVVYRFKTKNEYGLCIEIQYHNLSSIYEKQNVHQEYEKYQEYLLQKNILESQLKSRFGEILEKDKPYHYNDVKCEDGNIESFNKKLLTGSCD